MYRTTYLTCLSVVLALSSTAWATSATVWVGTAEVRSLPFIRAPVVAILRQDERLYVSSAITNGWRVILVGDRRGGYVQDADLQIEGEPLSLVRSKQRSTNLEPPRRAARWIVRPEFEAAGAGWLFASSENEVGTFGVTVGRNLTECLSTEFTLASDLPNAQSPGVAMMAVARAALAVGETYRQSALTVAAGPLLIAGGTYDTVAFGHSEIGYEYRGLRYTFLLTAGPDLAFNDSARQSTVGCGNPLGLFGAPTPPCVRPFNRGDVFLHVRIGWGFAFDGI